MRRALAGKTVTFSVEYEVESINRSFGVVFTESGENVSVSQVAKGLCRVKQGGNERAGNAKELEETELRAKAEEVGMWSKDPAVMAMGSQRTCLLYTSPSPRD